MEEGQLQQMVKDRAIAGADRLTTAKYHAAVTVVEQSSVVGSKLETNVALNATGDRHNDGVTQATNAAKKLGDLTSNGEQEEGKELEGVSVVVSAAGMQQKPIADQVQDRQLEGEAALVPVDKAGSEQAMHTVHLKATKNSVVDQALAGNSKGPTIEPRLLGDSTLKADARERFSKNNAAVAMGEQVDKAENRLDSAGSQLRTNVALNATDPRSTAGVNSGAQGVKQSKGGYCTVVNNMESQSVLVEKEQPSDSITANISITAYGATR